MRNKIKKSPAAFVTALLTALLTMTLMSACLQKPQATAPAQPVDPIPAALNAAQKAPTYENYLGLGMAYSNAGKHDDAFDAFEVASKINPKDALAYNNLCAENNARQRWVPAITECNRALAIDPQHNLARNNLDLAVKSKAIQDTTIEGLRTTLKAKKGDQAIRLELGRQLYLEGAYEPAIEVWREVSKKSELYATAQNNIASAYIIMKDFGRAKPALDQALKLEPNNALFQNNARWLATESGKTR